MHSFKKMTQKNITEKEKNDLLFKSPSNR